MNDVFLTAEWRKLLMVNYIVDPDALKNYVPQRTELDEWNGNCYVSLVGFMFENTKVKGCRIPFHGDFEEVNLRFYVRYRDGSEWKRGVVFIREFVPLPMVTVVANTLYQERYKTIPMRHRWNVDDEKVEVEYRWKRDEWHIIRGVADNDPQIIAEGTEEEFVTQHFWGFSQKHNHTSQYRVDHEMWKAYNLYEYLIAVDFVACYGTGFSFLNKLSPHSVYLTEGSPVTVYRDTRI